MHETRLTTGPHRSIVEGEMLRAAGISRRALIFRPGQEIAERHKELVLIWSVRFQRQSSRRPSG